MINVKGFVLNILLLVLSYTILRTSTKKTQSYVNLPPKSSAQSDINCPPQTFESSTRLSTGVL